MTCLHFDICSSSAVALCWLAVVHAITVLCPPPSQYTSTMLLLPCYSAGKSHCWLPGYMLLKRSTTHEAIHNLFIYVCIGKVGVVLHQWPVQLLHKGTGLSVWAHVKTSLIYENLINFAGDAELFSTIVPIFDCPLLKCQEVKTNARWPFMSQIYEHRVSFLPILLLKNNKWFWCQFC